MFALRTFCCAFLIGLSAPVFAADAFSSDWAGGLKSSARLILGDGSGGRFHVGVEIKLAPGAITYWRNPGDAGLPPVFNFDGSDNLREAQPLFPAPQRLNEGDGEAFGYDHSIILPIDVKAADPAKPVTIALKLNYAVCEKICVPARAELQLRLGDNSAPSPYAAALAEAEARVPKPIDWASLSGRATLVPITDKAWRFCLESGATPRDVFVETPAPWWFATMRDNDAPAGKSCFRVTLEQKPDDQRLPVTARFTVTGGDGAFETNTSLGTANP